MGKSVVGSMDEDVMLWVAARIPHFTTGEYPYSAIGQMDSTGMLVGGAVFTMFTGRDVHVHVAGSGPRWATRRFLGECFRYMFVTLGVRRCTGTVARSNLAAQRFDEGLGFRYEGILRAYLPGDEDCLIYGMLKEECKWLNIGLLTHGRKSNGREPTIAGLRAKRVRPDSSAAGH